MPNKSKGIQAYRKFLTACMITDKLNGMGYRTIGRKYKLDASNCRRRIKARLSELVDKNGCRI